MSNILILVANASEARLYKAMKIYGEWDLIDNFSHPESREKSSDIASDRLGNFSSRSGHGSMVESSDPKQFEIERFALELSNVLDSERKKNSYQRIVTVAPAHFRGLLKKHADDNVLNLIDKHLDKDYTKLDEAQIKQHLRDAQ